MNEAPRSRGAFFGVKMSKTLDFIDRTKAVNNS